MARFLAFAVVAFVVLASGLIHAGGKDFVFQTNGKFTKDDPKDPQRGGPMQVHTVKMVSGRVYTIDMVSKDFDSYLRLQDPKGNQLDEDDDSGGNLNSRIIFNCTKDGEYKIVTTTFGADATGAYALTVKMTGTVQAPANAHVQMIGNPAPDFKADFSLNGKATNLGDLKGKIVLLYFFDMRSSTSTALLPKLKEWNKAHKADGLTIVGLSFYPSEIGQKLGFDKDEGKIVTAEKADKKSDQALLKTFAEHHKLDYPLVMLTKKDAFQTYDAYVVNGVPQIVVIDRKGMVRHIDINGEKGTGSIENELKKLLADK